MSTSPLSVRLRPPPPLRTGYLPRPRLITRLNEGGRLTLVIAPAGYGKTTLLSHWARQQDSSPLAWCTLNPQDVHLTHFLSTLAGALAPFFPNMTPQLQELLFHSGASPRTAQHMLLDQLTRLPHPLTLVLDDVQHVDHSPDVVEALSRLVQDTSFHLRVLISARRFPRVPAFIRLRTQGDALVITATDLAFTQEETFSLLHHIFNIAVSPSQVEDVHRRTDGWPIALHLVARLARERGFSKAEDIWAHLEGAKRDLYEYLLHVVLADLPSDLTTFLRFTSILDFLEPDICARLTDRKDALLILSHLEKSGLFTFPQNSERTRYRYHALFRDFLYRQLIETVGEDGVRDLHHRAATFFTEQGDKESALSHFLAAADYSTALTLFHSLWLSFLNQGRLSQVEEWVHAFPKEMQERSPDLLLARAKLALMRSEFDRAEHLYNQAYDRLKDIDEKDVLFLLHMHRHTLYKRRGNFLAASEAARQALACAVTPGERAESLAAIAYARYSLEGATTQVLQTLHQAHNYLFQGANAQTRERVLIHIGRLYGAMGDFFACLQAWHNALAIMEQQGHRYRQGFILDNMAYYHYLLGDLEEAERLSARSLELNQTFKEEGPYSLNIQAVIRAARGDFQTARLHHETALRIQQRQGDLREIPVTMNWLGLLSRLEGRLEEALRWGQEGLARREQLGDEYEVGLSLIDLGATHMARKENSLAEQAWSRALSIFTHYQARYEQAQLHFYMAYLAYTRRDEQALRRHLEQSLDLAKAYEHGTPPRCLYFYELDKAWTAPLLAYALARGWVTQCAACLLPRLGKESLSALLPLLDADQAEVRVQAARMLAALRDSAALLPLHERRDDPDPRVRQAVANAIEALLHLPPEPLRVQLLGRFRLWRGTREMTHWPRRSARDVFILLLQRTPRPVPGEVLIELLWPNAPPHKAAQRLRRAISDLRHILEPELPANSPSRYIIVREGTYLLRLPEGSYVDVVEFEDAVQTAQDLVQQGNLTLACQRLEDALALYRGPYVPEVPYADWALQQRERLRLLLGEASRLLAWLAYQAGNFSQSVMAAQRALSVDPYDEEAAAILIRTLADQGHVSEAVRVYEVIRERLGRDLGVSPRSDLVLLYESLRAA